MISMGHRPLYNTQYEKIELSVNLTSKDFSLEFKNGLRPKNSAVWLYKARLVSGLSYGTRTKLVF